MRLLHGTSRALGFSIEIDGLKASGCEIVPEEYRKSCYSKPGYLYFTDDEDMAWNFACGVTEKVGIGNMGQIFELVDEKLKAKVEPDPLLPNSSWRIKTKVILPSKLKSFKIFKCAGPKEEERKRLMEALGMNQMTFKTFDGRTIKRSEIPGPLPY